MREERKRIKVLHVDDESDFLALTKAFLERENEDFSIDTTISAGEATELLKSDKYDVVVSTSDAGDGWSGIPQKPSR